MCILLSFVSSFLTIFLPKYILPSACLSIFLSKYTFSQDGKNRSLDFPFGFNDLLSCDWVPSHKKGTERKTGKKRKRKETNETRIQEAKTSERNEVVHLLRKMMETNLQRFMPFLSPNTVLEQKSTRGAYANTCSSFSLFLLTFSHSIQFLFPSQSDRRELKASCSFIELTLELFSSHVTSFICK